MTLKPIYDTRQIMRRAHVLRRYGASLSAALKQAWHEVKELARRAYEAYLYQLRYIHAAANDVGIGRDGYDYVQMLVRVTGVDRADEMSFEQRSAVIRYLEDVRRHQQDCQPYAIYSNEVDSSDEAALAVLG